MDIAVIGTGYVGLVTGAGLADFGNDVICCDIDERKIEALNRGQIPIYEPALDTIVSRNVAEGRMKFTTDLPEAIRSSRAIFIAVGTPPKPDGSADLQYVEEVARTIARYMNGPKLVITKSTVPIGTGRMLENIFAEAGNGHRASVISNPEFLREGSAIEDFMKPDRVVIGASDQESADLMKEIYAPLHSLEIPFVVTNVESSELIKYAANGFLATKISFINEIAVLCERLGADVQDVARGIGLDPRIGSHFLNAGLGFGGSCLPKDLSALIKVAEGNGVDVGMLREVERINTARVDRLLAKVERALWVLRNKVIAVFGVAFKPDTDDIRGAPSLGVVPRLHGAGAILRVYDPAATRKLERLYPPGDRLTYVDSAFEAVRDAHALVVLTDWEEFRSLDLGRVGSFM